MGGGGLKIPKISFFVYMRTSKVLHHSSVLHMCNTAVLKLCAHVIEGTLSTDVKFHSNRLKITWSKAATEAAVPKAALTQASKTQRLSNSNIHSNQRLATYCCYR